MLAVVAEVSPVRIVLVAVLVVAFWLGPAYLSGRFAASRGYSFALFLVLGLIFGLLTLLIVLVLPTRGGQGRASGDPHS